MSAAGTGGARPGRTWALIAGGGTGGHVVPALAIAQALVAAGHPRSAVHFVGSRRGLERRLVPAAGFPLTLLPGRGIARRLTWANVGAVLGLLAAVAEAQVVVARHRPAVVIAVGGYASVACVVAAAVWRVPVVVAEQNAAPGIANRLAGRVAAACAVSFPGTPLPRAVLTGNPVRAEVLAVDRSDAGRATARRGLGLPASGTLVAVVGGSLGARRLNLAALGLARCWAGRPSVALYHVVGERDHPALSAEAPAPVPGGLVYRQVPFEERMALVLAAADVVVGRAGASTVAELTVAGVPSILVPLPGAPADHQTANARQLAAAGAAVVVPDAELTAGRLAAELDRLLGDPPGLAAMAGAARRLARPGAADAVARLAAEHARA